MLYVQMDRLNKMFESFGADTGLQLMTLVSLTILPCMLGGAYVS